jgi:hypothetical protein
MDDATGQDKVVDARGLLFDVRQLSSSLSAGEEVGARVILVIVVTCGCRSVSRRPCLRNPSQIPVSRLLYSNLAAGDVPCRRMLVTGSCRCWRPRARPGERTRPPVRVMRVMRCREALSTIAGVAPALSAAAHARRCPEFSFKTASQTICYGCK